MPGASTDVHAADDRRQAQSLRARAWCLCPMGWVAGSALQLQQGSLAGGWVAVGAAGFAAALLMAVHGLLARWRSRSGAWPAVAQGAGAALAVCASVMAGWACAEGLSVSRDRHRMPPGAVTDWVVEGTVVSLVQPARGLAGNGLRWTLQVDSAEPRPQPGATGRDGRAWTPRRVELSWWGDGQPAAESLRPGQRWRLPVRLRPPHGLANPQGHDRELWLWEHDIGATGTVRERGLERAHRLASSEGQWVNRARTVTRERLREQVRDAPLAGVLVALVSGEQAAIDAAGWQLFRATGVAHLMSISGLHITLFAWLARRLVAGAWRRSAALCRRWPAPVAGWTLGLLAAIGYALFAGWGLPAQRTAVMLALLTALRLAGSRMPGWLTWLLALWAVTVLDPWAMLQPGFWLSFVAVGLLMAGDPGRDTDLQADGQMGHGPGPGGPDGGPPLASEDLAELPPVRRRPVRAAVRAGVRAGAGLWREQWQITLGLAPLVLLWFHQWSVVGLLANAVAIPAVTWVITPLSLAGLAWAPLWNLAAWVLGGLMALLQAMADWPWAVLPWAAPPGPLAVAALAGALMVVWRGPVAVRLLGVGLMLPALLTPPQRPAPGEFRLTALDVGQGSAVLLETAAHALLYDAGPRWSPQADAGERVVVPHLQAHGVQLDLLVLSHPDLDHIGGAAAVLRSQPGLAVAGVLGPPTGLPAAMADTQPLSWRPCQTATAGRGSGAGPSDPVPEPLHGADWDGVRITVLHPGPQAHDMPRPGNAQSCVLRVESANGVSALLTGDIDQVVESQLLDTGQVASPVTLLVLAHHGSRHSTSARWLQTVRPRWALAQAGHRNPHGHPHPAVRQRLVEVGAPLRDSAECGAAVFNSAPAGPPVCWRDVARRYWHHPALAAAGPP